MHRARLEPELLLSAYAQGAFPMAEHDGEIRFYTADPRGIFPLEPGAFHVPRTLRQLVRKSPQEGGFEIRINHDFQKTMRSCMANREGGSWINEELIAAYVALHRLGFAHSVEAWRDGELAGGLYGVAIRGLFAGESMFSRATDVSKVALVHLVERLRRGGFALLDSQYIVGEHMLQFGTIEIPRAEYKRRLNEALQVESRF